MSGGTSRGRRGQGDRSDVPSVDVARTAILLGAGASRDAGLELTEELARIIVERVEGQGLTPPPSVQALNFVYSQMIGYQGERGHNPLPAVNIETLVSALRLLAARESHEVAPFVASWKVGAFGFSRADIDWHDAQRLAETIREVAWKSSAFPGQLVEQIRHIASTPPSPASFKDAETEVLRGIHRELSKLVTTDYLIPIAELARTQPHGVDVISLNYDLAIERVAGSQKIPVDRGVDRWTPGSSLNFEGRTGRLNLIKVHGSLDWELDSGRRDGWITSMKIEVVVQSKANPRPWIVVGDREKLATSGPTLALLHAAEVRLQRADRLIIVGYSFSDAHINTMIQEWMTVDDRRTITVIDPGWIPAEPRGYSKDEEISLRQALAIMAAQSSIGPPRVTVLATGAAESLGKAISTPPEQLPGADVSVIACAGESQILIRVTNRGVDLSNVIVTVFARAPHFHVLTLRCQDERPVDTAPNGLSIGDLLAGEHVDFIADDQLTEPASKLDVTVSGRSMLDSRARTSVICDLVEDLTATE